MSDLCRCADEVRCDMRNEIERLIAESKADKIRLADMEATCEFLHETEADNERLQARVDELEAIIDKGLDEGYIPNEWLQAEQANSEGET